MKQQHNIALLVHSCDRYAFLYPGFAHFFQKHWDFSIPCNLYFATEEVSADIDGFTNLLSGKGQWTDRLRALLSKDIKEEYVLYLQEDMWLNKDVSASFFMQLFDQAIKHRWQQVKLHSSEVYTTNPTENIIDGFNISLVDNKLSGYLMSHQVTLWNKEFLLAQLPPDEHPWRNERKGTKRLRKLSPVIYHADYFAENGKPEINRNHHPLKRSEYQAISANGMLNDNIQPFIQELQADGNMKDYAAQLAHHYAAGLTHDGKEKPRKVDLFKRLKNWMTNKG
jgi:hypothetical protein